MTFRGGLRLERWVRFRNGIVMLRQRLVGNDTRVLVTHDASLRSIVEVHSGAVSFVLAGDEVIAPRRFLLAVPPRSVLAIRFRDADVGMDGVGCSRAVDDHVAPALEDASDDALVRGPLLRVLDSDAGAAPIARRARIRLHELLDRAAPVREAAQRVGVAPETLARMFAAAYRVTPKQYCQRARLFDAVLHLLGGASVMTAALRAGFNDLTRFYVQFRGLLGSTPGLYARIRKRQESVALAP